MGFKARRTTSQSPAAALRAFALGLPGAYEEYPWGEKVAKVKGKVFVFLGREDDGRSVGFSVKLPISGQEVLALPFAEPTGYGLGRSGWVSVQCGPAERVPFELLQSWVLESYRAVAPKKLLAQLEVGGD